jgi:hypothetical protein
VRRSASQTVLTIGALLPTGARATSVRLQGRPVPYRAVHSARGTEVLVAVPQWLRTSTLQVSYH